MGTFVTTVGVGDTNGGELRSVELLVDTGAAHTMLPATLLRQLNVEPLESVLLAFADGEQAVWPVGMATLSYQVGYGNALSFSVPTNSFYWGRPPWRYSTSR